MERLLQTEGIEARSYTWEQLGFEVGLDCSGRGVQRAMGTMDYYKCIACRRSRVTEKTAKDRMNWPLLCLIDIVTQQIGTEFASMMKYTLAMGLKTSSILSESRACVIVKTVQEVDEPAEKDKKRYHCWAAVGHNFKSDIPFYEVSGNTNGKMSQQVYIDQTLEPL